MHATGLFAAIFRMSASPPCGAFEDAFLERCLEDYVAAGLAKWPDFAIAPAEIVRYASKRTAPGGLPDIRYAPDLLLACACAKGVSAAVTAFYDGYGSVIARVLARRQASTEVAEDAAQAAFERLLTAPSGQTPKISEYKGVGPLRSWVAAAAATTLMMMRRAEGRRREDPPDSRAFEALSVGTDPELRYMKERYRGDLEHAVERALERLDDRERTLLRLHLGEQMTIDQLGALYAVNRATAARWLAAAREAVVRAAKDDLRERLNLSASECRSIVALVRSQLNGSVFKNLS